MKFPRIIDLSHSMIVKSCTFALICGTVGGCGSGGHTDGGAGLVLSRSVTTASGLTLTLAEDKTTIEAGESVLYTLTLTNTSAAPILYTPGFGCPYTVVIGGTDSYISVANAAGTAIAQLANQYPSPCNSLGYGQPVSLAPGQSLTASVSSGTSYNTAGTYFATADVDIYLGNALASSGGTGGDQEIRVGSLEVVVL